MMGFSSAGFLYLILALQLDMGFPPFYRRWRYPEDSGEFELQFKRAVPFFVVLMGSFLLYAITELPVFFLLFGGTSMWGGYWVRQRLFKETGGPRHWVSDIDTLKFPMLVRWTTRWPMLVFDIWTLVPSLVVGTSVFR
jgi:hypothetical protein